MKKLLLIIGIIVIIAGVLALLFAALNLFGYFHTLDGSAELYAGLRQRAVVFLAVGLILAAIGIVCIVIRSRIR